MTLNFQFEFETINEPGFDPRSLEPKAAMLTIEQQSIFVNFFDYLFLMCQFNSHLFDIRNGVPRRDANLRTYWQD